MRLEDVPNIIQQLINEIQSFAPDWNRTAGQNMLSEINTRVVQTGTNAQGNPMKNPKGQTYSSPYAKYRRKQGATSSRRIYNLTGDFWSGVIVKAADMNSFTLGGDGYSQNILNWTKENDGYNLVEPNQQEQLNAGMFLKQRLLETLNKYL